MPWQCIFCWVSGADNADVWGSLRIEELFFCFLLCCVFSPRPAGRTLQSDVVWIFNSSKCCCRDYNSSVRIWVILTLHSILRYSIIWFFNVCAIWNTAVHFDYVHVAGSASFLHLSLQTIQQVLPIPYLLILPDGLQNVLPLEQVCWQILLLCCRNCFPNFSINLQEAFKIIHNFIPYVLSADICGFWF